LSVQKPGLGKNENLTWHVDDPQTFWISLLRRADCLQKITGALCIARARMMLLYPPFWPLFCHGDTPMLRFDGLVTISETPALGVRRARKHVGCGDGQQAREERHAEERGGERARAAASETEYGSSWEDHVSMTGSEFIFLEEVIKERRVMYLP
jgi:hypothetical protein